MVYINRYGQIYRSNYLAHHGVAGQKWGQRNGPPYPLDEKAHSASEKKAGWTKSLNKTVRKVATGDTGTAARVATSIINPVNRRGLIGLLTSQRHREKRANRLEEKAKKAAAKGKTKKEEKLKLKASAQKQKNKDMDEYLKKTSTAKLLVQEALFRGIATDNYRAARARGEGRVRSALEAGAGLTLIGTLLRYEGDKKKYKAFTHSAM